MYIKTIIDLFEYIAQNLAVQQGGLGFAFGPEGEYASEWGDVYYNLFLTDSFFVEYTGTKNHAGGISVVFYVLARYKEDAEKPYRIGEQLSICEATGRVVIDYLTSAAKCPGGFSVENVSALTFTHRFSDDTVGVRFECNLTGAALPDCDIIAASNIDVCGFLNNHA